MTEPLPDIASLHAALSAFNRERDWEQFHTPRDLATALSVEAAELLELFLWRRPNDPLPNAERLREEVGDVFICLCNFARATGIDLLDAATHKLELNARRYPVAAARGNALKHDALAAAARSEPLNSTDISPEKADGAD